MPAYVSFVRIDFHVDHASPALRIALRAAKTELDSTDHTLETFDWRLRLFAQAHPEVRVDALVEDGFRVRWLFQARAGEVIAQEAYPLLASFDHDQRIEGLELEYARETELIAAVDKLSDAHAEGTMIVDVGWDRYLVQLAGGGASVLKAFPADRALVERLVRDDSTPEQRALSSTDDMLRVLR